jgi:hypothetical protein
MPFITGIYLYESNIIRWIREIVTYQSLDGRKITILFNNQHIWVKIYSLIKWLLIFDNHHNTTHTLFINILNFIIIIFIKIIRSEFSELQQLFLMTYLGYGKLSLEASDNQFIDIPLIKACTNLNILFRILYPISFSLKQKVWFLLSNQGLHLTMVPARQKGNFQWPFQPWLIRGFHLCKVVQRQL